MAPPEQLNEVELKVLYANTQQEPQGRVNEDTSDQVQPGQQSTYSAPQHGAPAESPDPPTSNTFPRIFKTPGVWSTVQDIENYESGAEAWTKTAEIIKTYSDDMIARWNAEIDTLLVYAGLFSAILTAFNVQSYPLLQPSSPDPTLAVLERISVQLGNFTLTTPHDNSAQSSDTGAASVVPGPTRAAVWLNILWFSGLIFSLASASIGILVKQWLREFNAGLQGTSREVSRVRQYRLNNLAKWRVAGIVSTLPVLLQVSLTLFLSGLLLLLWTLHAAVAAVLSALVGLLLVVIVTATVLPALATDCCYISPPTYVIYRTVARLRNWCAPVLIAATQCMIGRDPSYRWWFRRNWTKDMLEWLQSVQFSLMRLKPTTWRGLEASSVQRLDMSLDIDQIALAYSLTLQSRYLRDEGTLCLESGSFDTSHIIRLVDKMTAVDRLNGADNLLLNRIHDAESLEMWLYILLHSYLPHNSDPLRPPVLRSSNNESLKDYAMSRSSKGILRCLVMIYNADTMVKILKMLVPLTPIFMRLSEVPLMVSDLKQFVITVSRYLPSVHGYMESG